MQCGDVKRALKFPMPAERDLGRFGKGKVVGTTGFIHDFVVGGAYSEDLRIWIDESALLNPRNIPKKDVFDHLQG